jgi:predicted Zn-dependent protease
MIFVGMFLLYILKENIKKIIMFGIKVLDMISTSLIFFFYTIKKNIKKAIMFGNKLFNIVNNYFKKIFKRNS